MESLGILSIFIGIVGAVIGYFIGKNYRSKNDTNWQEQFETTNKELVNQSKQFKKEKKKVQQQEQQISSWKSKHESAEAHYTPLVENLNTQIEELNTNAKTQQDNYKSLENNHNRLINQYDQLKKDHNRLQEKYATDMSDSKGWKNKRDSFNAEIELLKKKVLFARKDTKEVKAKLDAQQARIDEANKFAREFRVMKADKRKLTKDLQYWEQKHFDTHHELAALKTSVEEMQEEQKELDLRFKGSEIEKQNMIKKIEEFKTKFVNVNNLYHELKAQKN